MMEMDRIDELLLIHFSKVLGRNLKTVLDLGALTSKELLTLANELQDMLLPSFVQMLKRSNGGEVLFQKMMGDHEEDNRELVDRFFNRYMAMVMEPKEDDFNPLLHYLPAEYFDDLVFLESRRHYFCNQSIDFIQEFLEWHFEDVPQFEFGEELRAWKWFCQQITEVDLEP